MGDKLRQGGLDAYIDDLPKIRVPMLVLGDNVDQLARKESVEFAFHRISSEDKQLRIFGKSQGDLSDYGHIDILLGITAPEEVYPVISEWFEQRSSKG